MTSANQLCYCMSSSMGNFAKNENRFNVGDEKMVQML